jgi:hypothetical protein
VRRQQRQTQEQPTELEQIKQSKQEINKQKFRAK